MTKIPSKKCKTLTEKFPNKKCNYCESATITKNDKLINNSPAVELLEKIDVLKKKLDIALSHLGQIAIHSDNRVDAVQAAMAIAEIEEVK